MGLYKLLGINSKTCIIDMLYGLIKFHFTVIKLFYIKELLEVDKE
jgi:hypothetical protein